MPTEDPVDQLESELLDGVVMEKTFVERTEPLATHNVGALDEDDSFLSIGSETWEYEVVNERQDDFLKALSLSGRVMEYQRLDDDVSLA
jgi:hypothetical protein